MAPVVSIVIVNFNGWRHLRECLEALGRAELPDIPTETIVVDNASTDNSAEKIAAIFPSVRIVQLRRNRGFGAANNVGVQHATGEYIALLNNDTSVEQDWLRHLLTTLRSDQRIGASCARLLWYDMPELLNADGGGMTRVGFGYDRNKGQPVATANKVQADVLFPTAAAMLMRKCDFQSCGGFDPAMFMYHEDVDLGWRLWLLGRRVVLSCDSMVRHRIGATTRRVFSARWQQRVAMRNSIRSMLKHYEWRNFLNNLADLLAMYFRNYDYRLLAHILFWNVLHLPSTLRERSRIQKRRLMSDGALLRRGLIDNTILPEEKTVPSPAPPVFSSPILSIGEPSAESRLKDGWHLPEEIAGGSARWTKGRARCFLHIASPARGVVKIRLAGAPPAKVSDRRVKIACNEIWIERNLDLGEQEIVCPASTNEQGYIEIEMETARWQPSAVTGSNDIRHLGCMVQEIRFESDTQIDAVYAPATASIIIPTYNRRDILLQTLTALTEQTCRNFDIIVVDDGSTDGTAEAVHSWQKSTASTVASTLIIQPHLNPGQARNRGLRKATGDIVIFIGDDTIPEPDFVEQHLRQHRKVGEGCAVVGYTPWDEESMRVTPLLRFIGEAGYQFGYGALRDGREAPFGAFYTANVSVARTLLGDEPFDPAFTFINWEDTELGYRLHRRGVRLLYCAAARARHYHPQKLIDAARRQQRVGQTSDVILNLHPQLRHDVSITRESARPRWPWRWCAADWLLPIWQWLDLCDIELPQPLYRAVLDSAFAVGRRRGNPF